MMRGELKNEALDIFQNLHGEHLINLMDTPPSSFPNLDQSDTLFLEREVSREEIKVSLFDIAPLKERGSDDFQAIFFQS